jgi:hypothetical protein
MANVSGTGAGIYVRAGGTGAGISATGGRSSGTITITTTGGTTRVITGGRGGSGTVVMQDSRPTSPTQLAAENQYTWRLFLMTSTEEGLVAVDAQDRYAIGQCDRYFAGMVSGGPWDRNSWSLSSGGLMGYLREAKLSVYSCLLEWAEVAFQPRDPAPRDHGPWQSSSHGSLL